MRYTAFFQETKMTKRNSVINKRTWREYNIIIDTRRQEPWLFIDTNNYQPFQGNIDRKQSRISSQTTVIVTTEGFLNYTNSFWSYSFNYILDNFISNAWNLIVIDWIFSILIIIISVIIIIWLRNIGWESSGEPPCFLSRMGWHRYGLRIR